MHNHSIQKRAFENGTGNSQDEHYDLYNKRPCRHRKIIHRIFSPTSLGWPVRADISRLPDTPWSRGLHNDASSPQASESEDVCFGMLRDVHIRFNYGQDTYFSILGKLGGDIDNFAALQLEFLEDRCDVLVNGVSLATMGMKTHLALKSLSSGSLLSYRGMVLRSELHQKLAAAIQPSRTRSSEICCKIALMVFGPRAMKNTLAKDLARYHLFLQHPVPMPEGIVYENPQYLSIVASSFGNGVILPPISTEVFHHGSSRASASDPDEFTTIATVLDNLPRYDYLKNANIDQRIRTMLLGHQKEAVDFLLYRESIKKHNTILWKSESFISEKPIYRHTITGSTSPKPNDILGGILGDGMGLGKTLSMIACIMSSLAYTENFANASIEKGSQKVISPAPVNSTLVIVPSVLLLDTWIDEIEKHVVPGTLSVYRYHGPNRKLPSSPPLPYHIVLSTYSTVAADDRRGGGVLACFNWYRLVLDEEAHVIRNWSTNQFKSIRKLSASIRWCITGTPVQNSLKDLSSLITFLRVPLLDDSAIFRKYIQGGRETVNGASKPDFQNLRHLLESICLRRCTSSILSSLGVSFIEHRPCLSEGERKDYNQLSLLCDRYIKAVINGTSSKGGNNPVLIAVLRLRMFCNTSFLGHIEGSFNDIEDKEHLWPDEEISLLEQSDEALCTNCKTEVSPSDADILSGERQRPTYPRLKCQECAQRSFNTQNMTQSSLPANGDIMQGMQYEHGNVTSYPSKILCLVEDIRAHFNQDKSIVFSSWRRSLDLIEKIFLEQGIVFGRVDGTMHPSKRREVLAAFQENTSIRVLLMTIGTGAVGLNNLSVANRVHILEPQWNPSIEDQAIGRVARLGQSQRVTVIRYIVKNTIEESIESRQLQKLQLALKSGLKSSNHRSEGQRRSEHLRTLGKIIESTVCTSSSVG